jgi:hypothetical protein
MIGFLQEENRRLKQQIRELQEENEKMRLERGRQLMLTGGDMPRGGILTIMGFTMDEVCSILMNYARENLER